MHLIKLTSILIFLFLLVEADIPRWDRDLTYLIGKETSIKEVVRAEARKDPNRRAVCERWCQQVWVTEWRHNPQRQYECYKRLCASKLSSEDFAMELALAEKLSYDACLGRKVCYLKY